MSHTAYFDVAVSSGVRTLNVRSSVSVDKCDSSLRVAQERGRGGGRSLELDGELQKYNFKSCDGTFQTQGSLFLVSESILTLCKTCKSLVGLYVKPTIPEFPVIYSHLYENTEAI